MVSRLHERLTKLEARVTSGTERVFVCFDENLEAIKAANAIGPHDHLVHLTFIDSGAPAVPTLTGLSQSLIS
jgi:hypothetical protein